MSCEIYIHQNLLGFNVKDICIQIKLKLQNVIRLETLVLTKITNSINLLEVFFGFE